MDNSDVKFTIICNKCGRKVNITENNDTGQIAFEGDNRKNKGIWFFGYLDKNQVTSLSEYISLDIYCDGCKNRVDDIDANDYVPIVNLNNGDDL